MDFKKRLILFFQHFIQISVVPGNAGCVKNIIDITCNRTF